MSLLDEIRAAKRTYGGTCSVATLLAKLTPADRADLIVALAATADEYPAKVIVGVLRNRDHQIAAETIRRHRRGECKCPSATS